MNKKLKGLELAVMKFLWLNDFNSSKIEGRNKVFCTESERLIGNEEICIPCCAHVLSKGAHSSMRYHRLNIIPLTLKYHQQLDFGKKKELKCWKFIEKRTEQLYEIKLELKTKEDIIGKDRYYDTLLNLHCYSDKEIEEIISLIGR